jgi:hypothetical protein
MEQALQVPENEEEVLSRVRVLKKRLEVIENRIEEQTLRRDTNAYRASDLDLQTYKIDAWPKKNLVLIYWTRTESPELYKLAESISDLVDADGIHEATVADTIQSAKEFYDHYKDFIVGVIIIDFYLHDRRDQKTQDLFNYFKEKLPSTTKYVEFADIDNIGGRTSGRAGDGTHFNLYFTKNTLSPGYTYTNTKSSMVPVNMLKDKIKQMK